MRCRNSELTPFVVLCSAGIVNYLLCSVGQNSYLFLKGYEVNKLNTILVLCGVGTVHYPLLKCYAVLEQFTTRSWSGMQCSNNELPVIVVLCSEGTVNYLFLLRLQFMNIELLFLLKSVPFNYLFLSCYELYEQLSTSPCSFMQCRNCDMLILVVLCSEGTVKYRFL